MAILKSSCRICKKVTPHEDRIVTENLPPYVKTLQCVSCGVMGVVLMEDIQIAEV
jgi:hypothetical protein